MRRESASLQARLSEITRQEECKGERAVASMAGSTAHPASKGSGCRSGMAHGKDKKAVQQRCGPGSRNSPGFVWRVEPKAKCLVTPVLVMASRAGTLPVGFTDR